MKLLASIALETKIADVVDVLFLSLIAVPSRERPSSTFLFPLVHLARLV